MQNVTPWPDSFDVSEPVARVLIDGQEVDVESVTVSSELDSAMPERVAAGGGGVTAATGSATILRADDVTESGFNPWGDAQRLVNASEIVVEAGYRDPETGEVGCARQVTGKVEALSGSALSLGAGLEFVDHTPFLDREITIEPLLQEYPSLEDWGPRRNAGLSPIYITDRILRHCGFYATPPLLRRCVFSAPMMGSAVPERGTLVSAWAESSASLSTAFRPVPWGMGLGNGIISYTPYLRANGHGHLTSTLQLSFHRRTSTSSSPSTGRVELRWGSSQDMVRVDNDAGGFIRVWFRDAGAWENVVVLPPSDVASSEAFSVLINPSGQVTIHASNGASVTGSGSIPSRLISEEMTEVYVHVPQSSHPIGGLQVAFSGVSSHDFVRTAHIDPPAYYHSLSAFPSRIKVNCLALLKEQAEAELAAMWVDEFGHFRWRNRHQLRESQAVGTLTSRHELYDISWHLPVRSVYSRVELEHDVPNVTRRGVPSITVSDNRGSTLSAGDDDVLFFEPSANEDWHQVDPPTWLGSAGLISFWQLKRGRRSYYGGVVVNEDDEEQLADSSRLTPTWQQINPQRWLMTFTAQNIADDEYIEQRFLDRPDLYGKFAGDNLPVLRAKGVVEWEQEVTTGEHQGPPLGAVFTHQVGPWVQDVTELQSLADGLSKILTRPDVILREVPIVPDPRVQLGDVFWLEDQTAYHIRLRVIVMGKNLRYQASKSGHEMTQTITCRVIEIDKLKTSYTDLQAEWQGRSYSALQSVWADTNYEALENNPLGRS